MCLYIYLYTYVCIYIFIYIYMNIYMYTFIYIYTYMYVYMTRTMFPTDYGSSCITSVHGHTCISDHLCTQRHSKHPRK